MLETKVAAGMSLPGDEERDLLRKSVRGFLAAHWSQGAAVQNSANADALQPIWRGVAAQGLTSLCTDPAEGGLREAIIAMEELGRAACPAPLHDAVLANLLLMRTEAPHARAAELLRDLHCGNASVAFAFGAADPDRNAGALHYEAGHVRGAIDFVDGAKAVTQFVVAVDGGAALACIAAKEPGVEITSRRALGIDALSRVEFRSVPATVVPVAAGAVTDAVAVARLMYAARAWGAADRAFELVVDYVKQRKQFGQPVGRFQAIQHKLANIMITLTGVRLALDNAADHFDRGLPLWRTFAASVWMFAAKAMRQVSLETHHAFGAIGYAEEHEAPRHFRRVHLDLSRLGGARAAAGELADRYLGAESVPLPQADLGEAGNHFRRKVRAWIAEHWSRERREAYQRTDKTHRDFDRALSKELGATGWLGLTWPKQFGGMERSAYELLAFIEECERAGVTRAGAPIQAASWMIHGTPEQQQRYLPELLRGEVMYGMWYSEPDSGSDLASIRTTAVRKGDQWVINGQKIWTTTYWADYMWLAARTDPTAKPPHAGISMFVIPKGTPGVTLKPMRTMYDGEFCNTFLDNVTVPLEALVGRLNGGWGVLTGSLGIERAYVGSRILSKVGQIFEELCEWIRTVEVEGRPLRLDPAVRDTMAEVAAQIEIGRQLALNSIHLYANGKEPTWEAAMAKVFGGELMERLCESALDMFGTRALLSEGNDDAPLAGTLEQKLRHSLMWVISIGTNEIQRNLIAQRGLGLPR